MTTLQNNSRTTRLAESLPMPRLSIMVLLALLYCCSTISVAHAGKWVTNKWDKRAEITAGGWKVAWGKEIDSEELAYGAVAVGVSILVENPAPFYAWVEELVRQSIRELSSNIRNELTPEARRAAEKFAQEVLYDLISGRFAGVDYKTLDRFQIKAGVASYTGYNVEWSIFHRDYVKIGPNFPSWQPYVAVRFKPAASDKNAWQLAVRNKCHETLWISFDYLSLNGKWIEKGWWEVDPGERVLTNLLTTNRNFYYFAESQNYSWNGKGRNGSINLYVVSNAFTRVAGEPLNGRNKRLESFRKLRINSTKYGQHTLNLTCK